MWYNSRMQWFRSHRQTVLHISVSAAIFALLAVLVFIFHSTLPRWVLTLLLVFLLMLIPISFGILAARRFPKHTSTIARYTVYLSLSTIIPLGLGYLMSLLFKGPITHEKELVQGILTVSSILLALNGVMLRLAKFPEDNETPEGLIAGCFRANLVFSLLAGLVTIFLALAWFANGTPNLIQWATFGLFVQLGCLLVFLLFPRYYLP